MKSRLKIYFQKFCSSYLIVIISRSVLYLIFIVERVLSNLKYRSLVQNCSNSICHFSTEIKYGKNIEVGENTRIGKNCTIGAKGGIKIGSNVVISKGVTLETANLKFRTGFPFNDHTAKPIVIGKNTWIGSNAIILGGVTIGESVVIGAGSIISQDVESFTIASMARVIDKKPLIFSK